jgi:tyrosinase
MKLFLLLLAASVASAAPQPATAAALPAEAFPTFHPVSLEEFKAGLSEEELSPPKGKSAGLAVEESAAAAAVCTDPSVRIEWRNYTTSDRQAFMSAIRCLLTRPPSGNFPPATNRYEDLARLHQLMRLTIHQNHIFLVWHRYYLWVYEQLLRDECGFDRPFPWWDETLDAGRFAQADLFTSANYFGAMPAGRNGRSYCVTTGAFANLVCNIGPGTNNVAHCLSRGVDETMTAECNTAFINFCNARTTFSTMSECAEGG